jgi:hypothetical protein
MQLQFRAKCKLKETEATKTEIIVFDFNVGPLKFICIVNIPREGETESVAYVKMEFESMKSWEVRDGG